MRGQPTECVRKRRRESTLTSVMLSVIARHLYVGSRHVVSTEIAVVMAVHPPYSPELAPPDFFLFPKIKEHLAGKRLANDEGRYRDLIG